MDLLIQTALLAPLTTTAIGLVSLYLIRSDYLIPIDRQILCLKTDDCLYYVECEERMSALNLYLISHNHSMEQVFPDVLVEDALAYFKINDNYIIPALMLIKHSHTSEDTIYYLHKNKQIYNYATHKASYTCDSNYLLLHAHRVRCLGSYTTPPEKS